MNTKNSMAGRGVLLVAALLAGGCSKPVAQDPRLQPPKVVVFKARASEAGSRAFTGIVEARVQSNLGFRVGGKILERCVDVGQHVQKGKPLMRLDPVDLELSAAAQQANVEAARARYVQARADETRLAKLVQSDVISPQDYDRVKAALNSAKADLEASEARAKVGENSSAYAVLFADADGVIVQTLSEPGQVVAPGQTVIQLAHDGPREAAVNLPEDARPGVGSCAVARLYGREEAFPAKLRQLSDAADAATRTFEARFVLEGNAASAPLGSTVTVTGASDGKPGFVRVPVGAICDRGDGPGVWIIDNRSQVEFRPVGIVSFGREEVVVSTGLVVGTPIVALGAHLLHEGQVVKVATEGKFSDGKL